MPDPPIPQRSSSRCTLNQESGKPNAIHRDEALEEYSIPTPQDVFEREDFEYVKEQAFQNALA